jgi:hypothetical protein
MDRGTVCVRVTLKSLKGPAWSDIVVSNERFAQPITWVSVGLLAVVGGGIVHYWTTSKAQRMALTDGETLFPHCCPTGRSLCPT